MPTRIRILIIVLFVLSGQEIALSDQVPDSHVPSVYPRLVTESIEGEPIALAQEDTRRAVDLLNQAEQTEDLEERLELLDEALSLAPNLPQVGFERAVVLSDLNRLDDADREFRRTIELLKGQQGAAAGQQQQTLLAWSYLNNCDVLLRAGRVEEAVEFGDFAIDTAPNMPMAHYNRGRAHLGHRSYGPALESLEAAAAMGMADALILRAAIYSELNETPEAILDLEYAIQLVGPNPRALSIYGQLLQFVGRYEESLEVLQLYSQWVPEDAGVQIFLGDAWLRLGEFELALRCYQRAAKADPDDPRGNLYAGDVYHQTGDHDQAEIAYAAAIRRMMPQDEDEAEQMSAWKWATVGQHHALRGEHAQAFAAYERALALDERDHWTLSNLALLLATCPDDSLRDGDRAVRLADAACELTLQRSWSALYSRAAALAEVGRFAEAADLQRTVIDIAPHTSKRSLQEQLARYESEEPNRDPAEIRYFIDGSEVTVDEDDAPVSTFVALAEATDVPTPLPPAELAQRYLDAVVLISSDQTTGTGIVLSEDGYVLTCAHVLPFSAPISVEYHLPNAPVNQNETSLAQAVVIDFRNDLALLKIEPEAELTAVRLALESEVAAGEDVVVIGNPAQGPVVLPKTMLTGIVSNPRQALGRFVTHEWIQTSVPVSSGCSGGPLINEYGEVIGIIVSRADFAQAGFAIPMDVVARFLGQDKTEQTFGN